MNIKFRAWHKEYKMMFEVSGIYWFKDTYEVHINGVDGDFEFDKKEIELMQWTGLQDRNNKDIYVGDLVRIMEYDKIKPILFLRGIYGYELWNPTLGYEDFNDLGKHLWSRLEIIGNIYENPELLNER